MVMSKSWGKIHAFLEDVLRHVGRRWEVMTSSLQSSPGFWTIRELIGHNTALHWLTCLAIRVKSHQILTVPSLSLAGLVVIFHQEPGISHESAVCTTDEGLPVQPLW